MMFANSSQAALSYVKELTFGTTPGSPSMLKLRITGFGLDLNKSSLVSQERRTDGQIPFVRHGIRRMAGSADSEISYVALKDWIRAALRYLTTAGHAVSTAGVATSWVAASKTAHRTSGSWVTDGVVANSYLRITDSTSNNGRKLVASVTASDITFAATETIVDEAASANAKINGDHAENGTTDASFSVEAQFNDITQFQVFTGVKVAGFAISLQPDAIPTLKLDLMGKDASVSGSSLGAATDVDVTQPCDTYSGSIKEGGAAIAIVTAAEINGKWNRADTPVLGSASIQSIEAGRFNVDGKITAYFQDATLYNKFLNETQSSLEFTLQDPAGNNLAIRIPACKFMGGTKPVSGDSLIMLDMPFTGFLDSVSGKSMLIDMTPAVAV